MFFLSFRKGTRSGTRCCNMATEPKTCTQQKRPVPLKITAPLSATPCKKQRQLLSHSPNSCDLRLEVSLNKNNVLRKEESIIRKRKHDGSGQSVGSRISSTERLSRHKLGTPHVLCSGGHEPPGPAGVAAIDPVVVRESEHWPTGLHWRLSATQASRR